MPNITINITRNYAAELFNLIHAIPTTEQGQGNYTAARAQVQKALLKVWPEAAENVPFVPNEVRPLELNPKQQRALAEGFLAVLNAKGCTGLMWANVERMAGPGVKLAAMGAIPESTWDCIADGCRVWGWVQSHAEQKPVPDFEGELDGEPDLLDPAPADASTNRDISSHAERTPEADPRRAPEPPRKSVREIDPAHNPDMSAE